jgi:hypothetical protein
MKWEIDVTFAVSSRRSSVRRQHGRSEITQCRGVDASVTGKPGARTIFLARKVIGQVAAVLK